MVPLGTTSDKIRSYYFIIMKLLIFRGAHNKLHLIQSVHVAEGLPGIITST